MKTEYCIKKGYAKPRKTSTSKNVEKMLNEMTSEGWEPISITAGSLTTDGQKLFVLFKRKKK